MPRRLTDLHRFWRDPALPYLEARVISGGRAVCYVPHSHPTFSIGAITGGHSDYVTRGRSHAASEGTVVLMNPEEVHACNPVDERPWSYRMLYVDADWLVDVQGGGAFQPYGAVISTDVALYTDLMTLFDLLFDPDADSGEKDTAARRFLAGLGDRVDRGDSGSIDDHAALALAADHIARHCTRAVRLEEVAAAAGLSPSYLVRAFKARYGLTPHAYQTNHRIRFGQQGLRRGLPIVDVALEAGFADQAHFQRVFKAHVAATPGQFVGSISDEHGQRADHQQGCHQPVEQAHTLRSGQ